MNILITGGAGFIGSHVVRLFVNNRKADHIYNLDSLTYAGNLENLQDVEQADNYNFLKADINNLEEIDSLFSQYKFDKVIHLAAESHVDRSIKDPLIFVKTNIIGTVNLLNICLKYWKAPYTSNLFYHISTDEVYGTLGQDGLFTETTAYDPNSPYSASKASSDHFVRSYGETYGLPYKISNCSNNYGPNQFPEKLIPLFINNCIEESMLPVYGDGDYTRDWLYVVDHAKAIETIFNKGKLKETYNVGGFNEWKNLELVKLLCEVMDEKLNRKPGSCEKLIQFVKDRPGHDKRYAIDASKIKEELGWEPSVTFKEGLQLTVDWYLANTDWLLNIKNGKYQNYYSAHYLNS
ncbi:dTDP-glucose 4,6-dehydratase [Leeuwenhoekiella sp. LLG6367-2.1]|uniref:dTDP-glucose 4,6-dehydratase n=1 Tax=Leeuwenhoekiella sp. LLG6367-2.1 TaxID=3160833 RepID=UPI0038689CC9